MVLFQRTLGPESGSASFLVNMEGSRGLPSRMATQPNFAAGAPRHWPILVRQVWRWRDHEPQRFATNLVVTCLETGCSNERLIGCAVFIVHLNRVGFDDHIILVQDYDKSDQMWHPRRDSDANYRHDYAFFHTGLELQTSLKLRRPAGRGT
jgi:hypothetical protein